MSTLENDCPVEYAFPDEDCFGFAGTLRSNYGFEESGNARLWLAACEAVEAAFGETDRRIVRNFLRSRYGRHLADDLSFRMPRNPKETDVRKAIATANWRKHWACPYREIAGVTRRGEWSEA